MRSREEWKVDRNVFSQNSERVLFKMASQGLFEVLESPIRTGKESNIFTALKKDGSRIVIKIYRLENCNFNKMYEYIRPDPRYLHLKKGKRNIIFNWVQREYRNMLNAREVIRVPHPIAFKDNILLMEYIGGDEPAPQMRQGLPVRGHKAIFKKVLDMVQRLRKAGFVHGDLSEYNVLVHNKQPVFIDFSQCTPLQNPNAQGLLERDVHNIVSFFSKYIDVNEEKIISEFRK